MPTHASFLYSRNVANFMALVVKDGELAPDFNDEIVIGTCVVKAGTVVHAATAEALGLPAPAPVDAALSAPATGATPAEVTPVEGSPTDTADEKKGAAS
jgi:NAD(P) transhydrogenase subunit alpha